MAMPAQAQTATDEAASAGEGENTPPPAPVPTMTTTLSSVSSNFAAVAMVAVPLQPVDVVKAAVDVTALREGLALIAEDRPDILLVV